MNTDTGEVVWIDKDQEVPKGHIPMSYQDVIETQDFSNFKRKNHMRNKKCVCGSGKKMKVCCWSKYV